MVQWLEHAPYLMSLMTQTQSTVQQTLRSPLISADTKPPIVILYTTKKSPSHVCMYICVHVCFQTSFM